MTLNYVRRAAVHGCEAGVLPAAPVPITFADNSTMIPCAPGTYALLFHCPAARGIRIGRLGELQLRPGHYIYVGSAFGPGGLRARIGHHQSAVNRPHWHIDYLRVHTRLESILYCCGARVEHQWAGRIATMPDAVVPMMGFGSSDCECVAHLHWFEDVLVATIKRTLGRPTLMARVAE